MTLFLVFEMLMSEKKSKTVFTLRGIHRTPEPTETQLLPEGSACSLWSTVPLGTRGPAQREISHSRGIKGMCCYGNVPQVSPEAQEEKAWGGREHRETPSKEACGQREVTWRPRMGTRRASTQGRHGLEPSIRTPGRLWTGAQHSDTGAAVDGSRACGHQGSHGREPGVRTAPPPTPGCSPDTPSTSCCSSPLARPASPNGVAVRLAVPSPVSPLPPWKASSRRRSSSALTVPSPSTDEREALQSQGRLFAAVVA